MSDETKMPDEASAGQVLDYDLACLQCGYNLRTQPRVGRCPECNAPVEQSWLDAPLSRANKKWLRQIRQGMTLVLNAVVGGFIGVCVLATGQVVAEPTGGLAIRGYLSAWLMAILIIVAFPLFAVGLSGVFVGTQAEPARPRAGVNPPSRKLCRAMFVCATVVYAVIWGTLYVKEFHPAIARWWDPPTVLPILVLVGVVTFLAGWLSLTLFWQTLARRANDYRLARATTVVVRDWLVLIVATAVLLGVGGALLPASYQAAAALVPASGAATVLAPTTSAVTAVSPAVAAISRVISLALLICALVALGFGVAWVVLVFRYRRLIRLVLERRS